MNSLQTPTFRDPLLNIFSFLEPKEVLQSERVCKLWKEVGGKQLQERAKQRNLDPKISKNELIQLFKMEESLEKGEIVHLYDLEKQNEGVLSFYGLENQIFVGTFGYKVAVFENKNGKWEKVQVLECPSHFYPRRMRSIEGKLFIESLDAQLVWEKVNDTWNLVSERHVTERRLDNKAVVGKYRIFSALGKIYANEIKKEVTFSHQIKTGKEAHQSTVMDTYYANGKLFTGDKNGNIKVWGPKN